MEKHEPVHQSKGLGEFVEFTTLNLGFGFLIRADSRALRALAFEAQQRLLTPPDTFSDTFFSLFDESRSMVHGHGTPPKSNEDCDAGGIDLDRESYRRRNKIGRPIGWLMEYRQVFSRFEKTAVDDSGMIKLARIHRLLRLACW